jgi:hypothetical protein
MGGRSPPISFFISTFGSGGQSPNQMRQVSLARSMNDFEGPCADGSFALALAEPFAAPLASPSWTVRTTDDVVVRETSALAAGAGVLACG